MTNPTMNNLKKSQLRLTLKTLATEERALLTKLLQHIALVDREKLFLEWGFPSLFEYLTHELGYSSGAAYRRLEAARLLELMPELEEKFAAGTLTLIQAAQMQKALRQVRKQKKEKVSLENQRSLAYALCAAPKSKSEEILSRELGITPKVETIYHSQGDGSIRVEFTFGPKEWEYLKAAQTKFSHPTGGGMKETILYLAKKYGGPSGPNSPDGSNSKELKNSKPQELGPEGIFQLGKSRRKSTSATPEAIAMIPKTQKANTAKITALNKKPSEYPTNSPNSISTSGSSALKSQQLIGERIQQFSKEPMSGAPATCRPATDHAKDAELIADASAANPPTTIIPQYIPTTLRTRIYQRDQYRDKNSNQQCSSKFYLEIDHIKPRFAQGQNTDDNLRLYCRAHNQWRYQRGK